MKTRSYQRYSAEFKEQALGLLRLGKPVSEADALRELRRENARLQAENDILKKAAIILGTRTPPSCAK